MFRRQYSVGLLVVAASCLALVAQANELVNVTTTHKTPSLAAATTVAPVEAVVKAVDAAINQVSSAPLATASATHSRPATGAPAALGASKEPTGAPAPPQASPATSPPAASVVGPAKVDEKLEQYFEPVCAAVASNKLLPKQLFKLQSQLKQFVEKTAGKMSLCFMTQYKMDPNLTPVTEEQLARICSSKSMAPDAKGSFKQFKDCAAHNWDADLDKEIHRIIEARLNFTKSHSHSANETGAAIGHSHDDDDELTMIGDVVKSVLDGNKEAFDKPGIKVIDVSGPAAAAAVANKLVSDKLASTPAPLAGLLMPNKKSLSDPNTVVVFVDEPAARLAAPTTGIPSVAGRLSTSSKPAQLEVSVSGASSTAAPAAGVEVKVASGLGEKIVLGSTEAPALVDHTHTSTSSPIEINKLMVLVSSAPALGHTSTTPSPEAATKTSSGPSTAPPKASTMAPATTTKAPGGAAPSATGLPKTSRPLEGLKDMLKRQEREKQELEAKLKVEREKIMKQLQKKQDEIDAKNAIKSLQLQRATGGHSASHADAKLHQIEHERQMSIDPVGHTIKHQQYEFSKQQKIFISG